MEPSSDNMIDERELCLSHDKLFYKIHLQRFDSLLRVILSPHAKYVVYMSVMTM